MNKQGSAEKPKGGIEWTHILGAGTGYTANPVRGCVHDCRWRMPDGSIIPCYAKAAKERRDGPGSFEKITFHPEVLDAIRKHPTPAGIFIDSMSDLFGQGVAEDHIHAVIATIADCPQHVFFSLTKNPSRFLKFHGTWPANWMVGISYPPTFMFGKLLTLQQQRAWFQRGLDLLVNSPAVMRWVSAEPLSLNLSDILEKHARKLCWTVIGAASDGARFHQPDETTLADTLAVLDNIPVFFKGNLSQSLARKVGGWRDFFPPVQTQPKQPNLL